MVTAIGEARFGRPLQEVTAGAEPSHQPESPGFPGNQRAQLALVTAPVKALPKGWPANPGSDVWTSMAHRRPPRAVMVVGAQGGVGTSTVAALLAETIAAASPGPTMAVDQSGRPWSATLSLRLLGEPEGLPGHVAQQLLRQGIYGPQVLHTAPSTAAGTALIDDVTAYTPLRELFGMIQTACGAMVVDGGDVDVVLPARLDPPCVLVLVGRADVHGAQAVCAALNYLQRRMPVQPVVVLSSTTPHDRRRIHAARKLVRSAGVRHLVHLPHDAGLASGKALRLDQVGKTTAGTCLQLITHIGTAEEVSGVVHRLGPPHQRDQPGPGPGFREYRPGQQRRP